MPGTEVVTGVTAVPTVAAGVAAVGEGAGKGSTPAGGTMTVPPGPGRAPVTSPAVPLACAGVMLGAAVGWGRPAAEAGGTSAGTVEGTATAPSWARLDAGGSGMLGYVAMGGAGVGGGGALEATPSLKGRRMLSTMWI